MHGSFAALSDPVPESVGLKPLIADYFRERHSSLLSDKKLYGVQLVAVPEMLSFLCLIY